MKTSQSNSASDDTSGSSNTARFIVVLSDGTCLVDANFITLELVTAMDWRKARWFTHAAVQAAIRLIQSKDASATFQQVIS